MDNKLNEQQIRGYSEQVAQKLIDSFFTKKEKISGEEILTLCTIKQVNLFTLKELFQKWNAESEKLESSYFDYENPEVIAVIDNFKNTVSRHILIDQFFFKPILTKAISDTLILICSPYHFYLNELKAVYLQEVELIDGLKNTQKFIKVNTAILEGLITSISQATEQRKMSEVSNVLDEVVKTLTSSPDEMEVYINAFSNYVPLDINDIYLEINQPSNLKKPVIGTRNLFEEEQNKLLNNNLVEEATLNESFAFEKPPSLADMHEQQKIESLSKGITLNQRFMFVNVLFGGDLAKFNNTVMEMDELSDLSTAKDYINTHFHHWNATSHEVEEFVRVLERRFC